MRRLGSSIAVLALCAAGVAVPFSAASATDPAPWGFGEATDLPDGAVALATGDLTGDGIAEAVRLVRRGTDGWRLVTHGFTERTSLRTNAPGDLGDLALGDVDGDGDADALVALTGGTPRHALHRNVSGELGAGELSSRAGGEAPTGARLRLADADDDGDLDALRLDPATGTLVLLRNDGTGTFGTATVLAAVAGAHALATGDLTGHGRPDIALGTASGVVVVRNDGSGGAASQETYATGAGSVPLVADVTGDGAADLVAATTTDVVSYASPAFDAKTTLLPFGASALAYSGGRLAGLTAHGPFVARRSGAAYAALHAGAPGLAHVAYADTTGDGVPEVYAADAGAARRWAGTASPTPYVPQLDLLLNAGETFDLVHAARNAPVPVAVTWAATRGTVQGASYTAPPSGSYWGYSHVTFTATVAGWGQPVTSTVPLLNDTYKHLGLAGREVRGFGAGGGKPSHFVTDDGVYAPVPDTHPREYARVGTTALTGTDARQVVVTSHGSARVLVARFGNALFRHDGTGDWTPAGPTYATSLALASPYWDLLAAAGGQVWSSADAGLTWNPLGGSDVVEVHAHPLSEDIWAVTGDGALHRASRLEPFALTPVALPLPDATVEAVAAGRNGADVTLADEGVFSTGGGPSWRRLDVPGGTTRVAVSPLGPSDYSLPHLAVRPGTREVYAEVNRNALTWQGYGYDPHGWVPISRTLAPGTTALAVWTGNGIGVVGTTNGVYWMVEPYEPGMPFASTNWYGTVGPDEPLHATLEFGRPGFSHPASFLCGLDGALDPCAANHTIPGPRSAGPHVFTVVAVDTEGDESEPYTMPFTVDATPPAAPVLDSATAARTKATSATFAFSADELDGARCSLDGATPSACESPVTYDGLGEGPHTFAVRALDAVGNASEPATHAWTVDLTPPAVPSLDGAPPTLTRLPATFAFTAPGAAGTTCSVDGGVPATCETGVTYALADGPHTFAVRAVDDVGNASEPATHAWTLDTGAPGVPSLSLTPPAVAGTGTATFEWDGEADGFLCSLDGAPAAGCASGVTYGTLAAGPHTFSVRAVDAAGNESDDAEHAWTVDLTPPAGPVLTSAPPAVTASTQAAFAWTEDPDADRYSCALDGAAVTCAETYAVGHGPHTFALTAHDDAGHTMTTTHSWTVDAAGPVVTIAAPPASLLPAVSVSLDEPGTVALTLRTGTTNVPATTTATTLTPVAPLVPGQVYTVTAIATDVYGNVAAPVTRTFRAPGSQQETSVAAVARWRRVGWSGAKGGWYSTSHTRGSSATFAFTGTSVTWHSVRGPSSGLADVYVDNVLKASRVNLYAPVASATSRTFGGLTNAPHTIRIVARGERGGGTGAEVAVDAFTAAGTLHASPVATWSWARTASYAYDDAAGATFSMTFRGRGVSWVTVLGPNMGLARVTVDGVVKGTFDNWASTTRYGAARTIGGLTDGVHTVTITVLGQRRSGATGAYVAVDRLDARI